MAAACGAEPEYEHWVCGFGPVTVPTNCRATSYQQLHLGSALLHDKAQVASGVLRAQQLLIMVWRQHILIVVSGRGSVVVGFAPLGWDGGSGWLVGRVAQIAGLSRVASCATVGGASFL